MKLIRELSGRQTEIRKILNRLYLAILFITPPLIILLLTLNPTRVMAATAQVTANDNFYSPPAGVTINVGDTVNWTNIGGVAHTVTGNSTVGDYSGNLCPNANLDGY